MPDIFFVFGPGRSYYLHAGRAARLESVPSDFRKNCIDGSGDAIQNMRRPSCICFGPVEQEYFAMYATWKGTMVYSYDLAQSAPELKDWLKDQNKITGTHVAIGPRRTFYISVPPQSGKPAAVLYHPSVPATFKTLIDSNASVSKSKFTREVCLGFGGAWFVQWSNGEIDWDLAGQYGELENILKNLPEMCVMHLALNPWAPDQYFLLLEDGVVKYCLPEEWSKAVEEDIVSWHNKFKTNTSSTISNGKVDSRITFSDRNMDLPIGGGRSGVGPDKDDPPPYEKKQ